MRLGSFQRVQLGERVVHELTDPRYRYLRGRIVRDIYVIAVGDVLGLIDVAIEHRSRGADPWKVSGVSPRDLSLATGGFARERQQCVGGERSASSACQLKPTCVVTGRELRLNPRLQSRVASGGVGLVGD